VDEVGRHGGLEGQLDLLDVPRTLHVDYIQYY
jgi:hypothetical protein